MKILKPAWSVRGVATNFTDNTSSGVVLQIIDNGDDTYLCRGSFDNKNLFGKFELAGEKKKDASTDFARFLSFSGFISFDDNDGSGFSPGTKALFSLNITLTVNESTGTYKIGKIPNSSYANKVQNGSLKVKRT